MRQRRTHSTFFIGDEAKAQQLHWSQVSMHCGGEGAYLPSESQVSLVVPSVALRGQETHLSMVHLARRQEKGRTA